MDVTRIAPTTIHTPRKDKAGFGEILGRSVLTAVAGTAAAVGMGFLVFRWGAPTGADDAARAASAIVATSIGGTIGIATAAATWESSVNMFD